MLASMVAKDKGLKMWIHDSEAACMSANIFISHKT